MLKQDFQKIFNEEVEYFGKRFDGADADEKAQTYRKQLKWYYDSLGCLTESQLEAGFKACREELQYFPKINQLKKNCPSLKAETYQAPKFIEPSPEAMSMVAKAAKGSSLTQVGEQQIRKNIAHCSARFNWSSEDTDKILARELEADQQRQPRGE